MKISKVTDYAALINIVMANTNIPRASIEVQMDLFTGENN